MAVTEADRALADGLRVRLRPPRRHPNVSLSFPGGQAYSRFIGEKPLPGDEDAPLETGAAEGSISTTRSNIPRSGAAAATEGSGPDAPAEKVAGATMAAPPRTESEETDAGVAAGGINTTRSNIKHATAAAAPALKDGGPTEPAPARVDEGGAADIAIKEQGVKVDGGTGGSAIAGEPIPGIDVKLGKNQGGAVAGTGPVKPTPTRPGDPFPPDGGPGSGTAMSGGEAGEADAGGNADVAAAGQPIPGIDVIVKKNPPR